jgi:uncharacterized membrane protein YphA (DoxX/SURF4 family)
MHDLGLRILLAILAFGSAVVGVWAQFFPRSFYDSFPGMGRHWVAVDGPYNEHLVRDVGGLNLALVAVLVAAIVTLVPVLVRIAAIAYLIYALPHFIYHLHHLEAYETADQFGNAISLAITVVVPLVILAMTWSGREVETPAPATARTS